MSQLQANDLTAKQDTIVCYTKNEQYTVQILHQTLLVTILYHLLWVLPDILQNMNSYHSIYPIAVAHL